ncbi:MAG: potassium transporter KefA [Desulfobacteraceae bacterium]|nr:MAG: potassium transporter KefA [Desulfobacteraceae bacterium]
MKTIFAKTGMEKGSQLSMSKLVHYVIVSVGFLFAISALGIDVSKLTLMLSALGVGLGFGMQGIMNNFVSGLILLFERPIRMGDSIEVDGMWAEVTHIGLRSTVVKTLDQADVIVPNSVLIANNVTNWTLSNRQIRLRIPIGVAYGSDVPLVMETLIESAKSNPMVAKRVLPQVLFLSFGDSALNFELRVWILNVDERLRVSSEINQEIERRFREVKIEIAFPQRDLHLRSVDESIFSRHPEIIKKDQGPVPECVNGI